MRMYEKPEINIKSFLNESVVTASSYITALEEWGSKNSNAKLVQVSFNDILQYN